MRMSNKKNGKNSNDKCLGKKTEKHVFRVVVLVFRVVVKNISDPIVE